MRSASLIAKKKYVLIVCICFLNITSLLSQPVLSKERLNNNDSLKAIVGGIARTMYPLMGGNGTCPNIVINSDGAIASYRSESKELRIDPKVIREIVSKFGWAYDDCLAIIIGHELWHAIHHKESGNFGDPGIKERYVQQEIDSDFYGLLGAHLAGYTAAFTNYDTLLNILSPKSGSDHPVLAQRLEGDDNVAKRMEAILPLYKIGTYNLLMGGASELNRATACFTEANARLEGGNKSIEFPQFNYQLGLVYFSLALLDYGKPWVFPLEALDPSFLTTRGGNGTTDPVQLKTLLDASERYFQKVLHVNPNHWNARLGMACVATLRVAIDGNTKTADDTISGLMDDLTREINKYPAPQQAEWAKNYVLTLNALKDKATLLRCLVPIIPENPGVAAKQQANEALKQLGGTNVKGFAEANIRLLASKENGRASVSELSLPVCDGLDDNNWKEIIPKLSSQSLISTDNIGGVVLKKYRLNTSDVTVYGIGLSTYVFQEYDTCPLNLSTVKAAGGIDRTGTGNYRYFDNPTGGHSVIIELGTTPKNPDKQKVESCVKIFKKKM